MDTVHNEIKLSAISQKKFPFVLVLEATENEPK